MTGKTSLIGYIDPARLTHYEKTQILQKPKGSFYSHYERPGNKKIEEQNIREWKEGDALKFYKIMPDI